MCDQQTTIALICPDVSFYPRIQPKHPTVKSKLSYQVKRFGFEKHFPKSLTLFHRWVQLVRRMEHRPTQS